MLLSRIPSSENRDFFTLEKCKSLALLIVYDRHLVDITHHYGGEEDLREWGIHGVYGGHDGGVHEVHGVAVQEEGGAAQCDA